MRLLTSAPDGPAGSCYCRPQVIITEAGRAVCGADHLFLHERCGHGGLPGMKRAGRFRFALLRPLPAVPSLRPWLQEAKDAVRWSIIGGYPVVLWNSVASVSIDGVNQSSKAFDSPGIGG